MLDRGSYQSGDSKRGVEWDVNVIAEMFLDLDGILNVDLPYCFRIPLRGGGLKGMVSLVALISYIETVFI